MVKYIIRLPIGDTPRFHTFLNEFRLARRYMSTGFFGEHADTILYTVDMTQKDALALRLTLPTITMMENQYD
jgi:hypothetical protein